MFLNNRLLSTVILFGVFSTFFCSAILSQNFDNISNNEFYVETYLNVDGIEYWFTELTSTDESFTNISKTSEVCGAIPGLVVSCVSTNSDSFEFKFNADGTGIDSVHYIYHNLCGYTSMESSSYFQSGPGMLIDPQTCIAVWNISCISNIQGGHELTFDLNNGTVTDRQSSAFSCSNICAISQFSFTITDIKEISSEIPAEFILEQNYPNPFNPSTTINFQIPENGFVKIIIIDLLGREIKTIVDEYKIAGKYSVEFNAENLTSGNYFYRMELNGYTQTKKLTILK